MIDDLGNDETALARVVAMSWPLSGAVLPRLPHTFETAKALETSGKEVLLHLPMEPRDPGTRPGPGLVTTAMSVSQIASTVAANLEEVPQSVGVNNHMGSKATADPRVMNAVLAVLKKRGLFFVDSRTTDSTVAEVCARQLGVPVVSRKVFLDDTVEESAIVGQLLRAAGLARQDGSAVAIGHPHAMTLDVLERNVPALQREGIRLVKVSELVGRE